MNNLQWLDEVKFNEQGLVPAIAHLQTQNIDIVEGPIERTGAMGKILSVYLRDPDQNLIEISNYITN